MTDDADALEAKLDLAVRAFRGRDHWLEPYERIGILSRLASLMVKGGSYHAGQVCVSTQRIFVHADVLAAFVDRFAARVGALRVGDPLAIDTEVGPLIHPREADRVESWIEDAVGGGARVVVGGERLSTTTLRPTVVVEPPAHAKVSRAEVFGPVTCVYAFTKLDEAIEVANSLPFAFQASVFTREICPTLRAAGGLHGGH